MSGTSRVLVVDDSPTQVQALAHMLHENGFETVAAHSGIEALETLAEGGFDLVLSDVVMPGLSGYELCREIKSRAELKPAPPVVLLTSLNDPVDIVRGLEGGADNYITKPYQPEDLVARLRQVIANRELHGPREDVQETPLEIQFLGRSFTITADRRQILELLLSSYEELVRTNKALADSRVAVAKAHQRELAVEQRARAQAEEAAARMEFLARASALFSAAESEVKVGESLSRVVAEELDCSVVAVLDEETDSVYAIRAWGPAFDGDHGAEQFDPDPESAELLKSWCGAEEVLLLSPDDVHRVCARNPDQEEGPVVKQAVAIPLKWRGQPLGVLIGGRVSEKEFHADDVAVLEEIGGRAASALDGHRLLEQEKRAVGRAEGAVQLRDHVMAAVSHDLRNPVGVAYTGASLLLEIDLPPDRQRRQIELIKRAADRANRLIDDLLVVSTMDSGTFQVDPRPVPAWELLDEAREIMEPLARDRKIDLEIHGPDADLVAKADAQRVYQVLSNLVGNAIKYTKAGGSVSVSAEADGDMVLFEVTDTGQGIAEDELPRIFGRFYQIADREKTGGAGLGLALAAGIVDAHGGTIEVESEVGVGSTFRFTIPRYVTDA